LFSPDASVIGRRGRRFGVEGALVLSRSKVRGRRPRSGRGVAARARYARAEVRSAFEGLEQHHRDLLGLGLAAIAVYLGFVLYAGWDGGAVGHGTETALRDAFGQVAYVVPIALAAWSAALIMHPFLTAPAAINAGGIVLLCSLLLAFAAETLGLGPDHPARHGYFDPRFYTEHGGAVGEALYWSTTTLFQRIGAQICAVLMFVSGSLLLSGATIAGLLSGAGRVARRAHEGTRAVAKTVRISHGEAADWEVRDGDEIAVTRAAETERLTPGGFEPDTAETRAVEGEAEERTSAWEEEDVEPPGADQFAYEEATGPGVAAAGEGSSAPARAGAERHAAPGDVTPMGNRRSSVTESEEIDYALPAAKLLERGRSDPGPDTRDRETVSRALLETLAHFGVEARLVGTVSGPHVSRYELQLAPGTKVSKIAQLKDDLAYALASTDIRILAPIPGKKAVGVEVPNQRRRLVRLGDIYDGRPKGSSPLAVWLGKDVSGHAAWTDLALMPHALVAGTTGSGKSGCVNAMLCSILLHASPNEVRMVLVDPKRVELNHYERLPHLLTPVVINPRLAANVLANLIGEMESRYAVMGEVRARNLVELNRARKRAGEASLPHILCVIDELADLMMVAPAEVEDSIIRLAQKSRAVGIHLVLATQRPSTDVITGTIKVNIPARIAFAVASQVDSRVILDQGGAESLLGQGDMLFRPVGTSKLQRIQGAFVTEEEIARLTRHWARQGEPEFDIELLEARTDLEEEPEGEFSPDRDDLLEDAARIVVQSQTASVSMLQRRLRVGYTRAGRLIDMLERRGIISGYEGSKPRQVLVSEAELPRMLERLAAGATGGSANAGPGADDGPATEPELEPLSG
jgi:DNA segregation ATPase FtsK/SpoIIIE, S-DNA-T family